MRALDYLRKLNQTEDQQKMLSIISKSRGYSDNRILNAYRAIYIPNEGYMQAKLGKLDIAKSLYTSNGNTYVPGKLFIPGFTPLGHLITYVAYDAKARLEAKETGDYNKPYYFYPEESTGFRKSDFILMPFESWEVAIREKRISIGDGVFDSGAVSVCGIPCGSTLGTTLGSGVKKILSVFDTVTQFKDNDSAGTELYKSLEANHRNVNLVHVPYEVEKDIDGYILSVGEEKFKELVSQKSKISLPKRRIITR